MRRAFTILELLATTALSAVLMVAALHVLGSIGRGRTGTSEAPEAQVWRSDLRETLRRDLAGSTGVRYGQNSLVLTGAAALDRNTLAAQDAPVTIFYSAVTLHGRNWLARRQSARNSRSNDPPWTELLCPDIVSFSVRPGVAAPGVAAATGAARDAVQSVPACVVVRLEVAGEKPVEETLVLR